MQELEKFEVPNNFRGRSIWHVQLWRFVQATLFHPSPQVLHKWRIFLLRLFGAQIGKNVIIRPSAKITYPWKLKIGNNSWVGDNVELYSLGDIIIGRDVVVSQKS